MDSIYQTFLEHPQICIDTRVIKAGSLFFALRGDHFDGNTFAAEAIANGASYAIVSDPKLKGSRYIYHPDPLVALQQLAQEHRRHFTIPVIAITGSNGKTTTKELLSSVLSTSFITQATSGNLNNHIGVPLTLLQLEKKTEILICEMGANHIGEIAALCEMANPTHGLITNIGKAHLEGFGSFNGVIKAKGELFDFLETHQGFGFINADDPVLATIGHRLENKTSYGLRDDVSPDIHFRYRAEKNNVGFDLLDRHSSFQIHSSLFGFYNASNILAAFCVGKHFGVEEGMLAKTLSSFTGGANRSEKIIWKECTIIKDAYNANPSSMELALQAFADQCPEGWLVLGDMKELGAASPEAHLAIVKMAVNKKFAKIFLIGSAFKEAVLRLDHHDPRITVNTTIEDLSKQWSWESCQGETLLLKGSRSMHLEKLLD